MRSILLSTSHTFRFRIEGFNYCCQLQLCPRHEFLNVIQEKFIAGQFPVFAENRIGKLIWRMAKINVEKSLIIYTVED